MYHHASRLVMTPTRTSTCFQVLQEWKRQGVSRLSQQPSVPPNPVTPTTCVQRFVALGTMSAHLIQFVEATRARFWFAPSKQASRAGYAAVWNMILRWWTGVDLSGPLVGVKLNHCMVGSGERLLGDLENSVNQYAQYVLHLNRVFVCKMPVKVRAVIYRYFWPCMRATFTRCQQQLFVESNCHIHPHPKQPHAYTAFTSDASRRHGLVTAAAAQAWVAVAMHLLPGRPLGGSIALGQRFFFRTGVASRNYLYVHA